MKETNIKTDLKLLIDISCAESKTQKLFNEFHSMLLRMCYRATNVSINYEAKRVGMQVLTEDEFYDGTKENEFAESMAAEIKYHDINTLLKCCINIDEEVLKYFYPFLKSSFFKRRSKQIEISTLEVA